MHITQAPTTKATTEVTTKKGVAVIQKSLPFQKKAALVVDQKRKIAQAAIPKKQNHIKNRPA